jgi:hypothetical protein
MPWFSLILIAALGERASPDRAFVFGILSVIIFQNVSICLPQHAYVALIFLFWHVSGA